MTDIELLSLFRISVSIHNFNKTAEKEIGLSLVQWCLLRKLMDMPATSAFNLAKSVGVHPSTLTQTLRRLEKKNFVFVSEDPMDSRKKVVSLTRKGKNALDTAAERMKKWKTNFSLLQDQSRHKYC